MDNSLVKFLGMVCARSGSKRLINKNSLPFRGRTLADNAIYTLLTAGIKDVYLSTDKPELFKFKNVIKRPDNLSDDETPLQDAVLWTYKFVSMLDEYHWTVLLMPTAPMITHLDIRKAMRMAENGKFNIIRSYSDDGSENGLYLINNKIWDENWKYDVYTGAIFCNGKEIHTEEEYNDAINGSQS